MPQVKPGTGDQKPNAVSPRRPYSEIENKHYNMNNKHRGLALIFNHENFCGKHSTRRGTNKDRDRLSDVLTNLGFKVLANNDFTFEEIYNTIQQVAKMDHSQNDCLLITVLTHGEQNNQLFAKDTMYSLEKLWCYFTDKRCPTLVGKPKIFFIQACRGDLYDDGITLQQDGASNMKCFPTQPDFLFAFSTMPNHFSWRNTTHGSWFIQTICDMLTEYATDTQILTLLTFVCRKVAVEYESYTDEEESNEKKEMPAIYSTLIRLLIFENNNKKKKMDCCVPS